MTYRRWNIQEIPSLAARLATAASLTRGHQQGNQGQRSKWQTGRAFSGLGGLPSGLLFTPLETLEWIKGSVDTQLSRCVSPFTQPKQYELLVTTGPFRQTYKWATYLRMAISTLLCGDVNDPFLLSHGPVHSAVSALQSSMRSAPELSPIRFLETTPNPTH